MMEILVITHGSLAKEFVKAAEAIMEKETKARAICLDFGLSPNEYISKIEEVMKSVPSDRKLIILTDLFGGTPSNLSIPFIKKDQIEVITGVNLPMLLFLLSEMDDKDFPELCREAKKTGEEAIVIAGEFLT